MFVKSKVCFLKNPKKRELNFTKVYTNKKKRVRHNALYNVNTLPYNYNDLGMIFHTVYTSTVYPKCAIFEREFLNRFSCHKLWDTIHIERRVYPQLKQKQQEDSKATLKINMQSKSCSRMYRKLCINDF